MEYLATLLDPNLRLPIGGTTYTIRPPSATIGLRLEALNAVAYALRQDQPVPDTVARTLAETSGHVDLVRDSLGRAYDEMVADDLPLPLIRHAGRTAFRHWVFGPEAGAAYWALGADAEGKAAAATRSTSTSTAAAPTTPNPSSTTGTTSPRTSKPA